MLDLAWPWALLALPLPLLARYGLPAARGSGGAALRLPFYHELRVRAGTGGQGARRRPRYLAATLIWLALVAATARPQWLGEPISLPVSGRDLMLAVDVSGSMETPDLDLRGRKTTRLAVVQAVAGDFIRRRVGDRIGLILFGSQAYLQTPLTFDRATVEQMLGEAAIGIAGKQTAIGDAIGLAVKRLRETRSQDRILILMSDGANTAGEVDPRQAARIAREAGLRIYTIGIGAEALRVRGLFGSRTVNPSAELDEEMLQEVARVTGGRYFRARDTRGLKDVYTELDRLEPTVKDTRYFRPVRALYYWPLAAALCLSVLWAVWPGLRGVRRVPLSGRRARPGRRATSPGLAERGRNGGAGAGGGQSRSGMAPV